MDVLGCLLSVVVHAANIHDTKGGISTARRAYERYPSIQKFCADAGYRGTFVSDLEEQLDLDVDISEKMALRKILCKRDSTKSRLVQWKQCRKWAEALPHLWSRWGAVCAPEA